MLAFDGILLVFVGSIVGMLAFGAGAFVATHFDGEACTARLEPYYQQRHDYSEVRIISGDGHVIVRAVESPGIMDDRCVETIIDGALVSRTHPSNFDNIWEAAKR
jgi:hypothetical protein